MKTLLALALVPSLISSVAAAAEPPVVWSGSYRCAQGVTALTLTLTPAGHGNGAEALFHFSADPSNPNVPEGCFAMTGTYDANRIHLRALDWRLHPDGYITVDLDGTVSRDGRSITGHVYGLGCSDFTLTRAKRDSGVSRCGQPPA